jgi:hypothetical protein
MTRPIALILSLLVIGAVGGALAEEVAPFTPAFMETAECVSAPTSPNTLELPPLAPLPKVACLYRCSVDEHRDCDAYCVQNNFLGGSCCTCSNRCLCTGQDPADVCT